MNAAHTCSRRTNAVRRCPTRSSLASMLRVLLVVVALVTSAGARAALPRVYVAPVATVSAGDKETARLVEARVLVAARAFKDTFDIVGAADVQGILDVEATKA